MLRRQPLGGSIRLTFEREPDANLAAGVEGERHRLVVVRDTRSGRIVATGSRAVRRVWLNGRPEWVGYLGLLRRDDEVAGRVRLLAEGFAALDSTRQADELPFDLTSIIADNAAARRLLERGLRGLPCYEPLGGWTTLVLPTRPRRGPKVPAAGPATPDDLPEVAALLARRLPTYQLASHWMPDDLRSPVLCRGLSPGDFLIVRERGAIVACAAVWDQRGFRQTVIRGYTPGLARVRPLVNAAARCFRRPQLPVAGETLKMGYLSHLSAGAEGWVHAFALISAALRTAHGRGLDVLVLGLAADDPLLGRVRRAFGGRAYESVLYAVRPPDTRSVADTLDGRPLRVEGALL